jgi:hypothetical protein
MEKKDDNVERIKKLQKQRKGKEVTEVIQLPLCFDSNKRATPNSFIRSALFSAIQSKDRVFLKGVTLASQSGIEVKFTGEQLNQEDLTLWETLVNMARTEPFGTTCSFSAYSVLKAMALSTGGDQHKQLHEGITRLNACSVAITHENRTYFGSLIISGIKDELESNYTIQLNPQLIRLFGDNMWTEIDWKLRLSLRRKPLAQALFSYYSSHKNPFPVTLEFLQRITGSRNTQRASFKRLCRAALESLKDRGFLKGFEINSNLVSVERVASLMETRH